MPPVVIAAAVSMAAAGAAAATWIAASTALIITIGASVAGALLTKPPSFGNYTSQQERKQVLRSSTAPQAHIYGRTVTSGLLFFAEEEKGSSTKEWVHLAIALCGHAIDGVEEIWLGDEPIRNYGSNATYEIHSDRQTADPFMLANCASWKDDMIGKGITWARISLKFDADKFPAGIPNIKFLVRGKRVLDPRNNTVAWTDNAALCIRDYYASYLKVDEADINTQQFIQAANICDQTVTNNGVTRKRYTINGTFDASEASSAVLDDLHLACAGEPTFMAGQHGIFVGAYYGPAAMNLVNSQIVSDVQIIPEASFGDKLNIVTGTFLDPNAQFAETEFPQVRVDQYINEDGAEFVDDVKYRFVANVYQAQQLAQIKINRTRIGRSLKFTMNMSGYSYRPGYYVKFTLDELGISNQEFRITDWSINATKGVDITLRQETPAVWLDIIGQPIERPDITDFPSQGIAAPLNLAFTVLNIGDVVQGRLTWKNGTVDVNYNIVIIRQAGKIIQSIQVPGETVDITGLPRGSYEMAVVSVNHFGQHSPEAMIVAEIHAPNTPTSVLMDNGYFEYTLKPQSSDLATVSVQYDFWTSGTTKLANTSDGTVTGNATRKGIGKTWTEASDKNDRIYYWYIRSINAFGTSPFIEFAAHFQMEPGKAIDFIDDNIKGSGTYQELDKGIVDNSQAISNANQVINNVKTDVANIQADVNNIHIDVDTIQRDVLQIQIDVDTNTADIAKNVDSIAANTANITKNAQDILANTSKINKEITDRTNAVSAEATARANAISQTAKTAADNLLNEKLAREAAIDQTNTVVQNNYDSLATQIAQVSAGTGQQFDSARIYYFDKTPEGWSLDDAGNTPMLVTEDGWLKAPTGQAKFDARSSNDLNVNGSAYKFLKLRIRKVGTPNWVGQLFWIGSTEQGWTDARKYNIPEPSYDANGVSTLDINDLPWSASNTLRRIRLNLSSNQTTNNYYLIDFVAIGRPTPGASTAALEEERTARVNADASEAAARQTLAAQVRGGYDGTDPSQLTSGLIYSERQVRITAEQAISQSVNALQTDYNNNKTSVQQSLDTLTNKTTSNANAITNLSSTVDKKADATALNALTTRVSTVEGTVTSQGNSITSLTSSLNTLKNQTSNPWLDGSFESYANGTNLSGSDGKCVVTTDQRYTGSKSLKVSRGANESGNSDKILAVRSNIRENSYYRFELYALMPADQQPSNGWNCNVGFNLRDAAGNNAWPTGIVITEAALTAGGGRDRWVKFSGVLSAGPGKTDAAVWISPRGANGAGTPGYTLYIDQFSIVDITEARAAQQTADANAQATSALETRVTTAEGNITSQGSQITSLRNDLTSVQGQVSQKADASALATLSTKVDQQGSSITSQGQSITDLSNNLSLANNDATASHAIPTNMLVNPSFERMLDAWTFSSGGPNGAESIAAQSPTSGARMLRTNPVGTVVISQNVKLLAGRTYKYGCFVRAASGTNLQDAGNNKVRLGNLTTGAIIQALVINPADLPTNSTFKEYSGTYTPTADILVTLGLCSSINAGYQYWDDAYIVDITGEVKADANAAATTALTTRVSNAEGAITSQGSSITQLRNDLTATNAEVAKKASSAALTSLESTVTQQGKDITTQGQNITQLRNDLTVTQGQVSQKADATAVSALTQRVTDAEGKLTTQSSSITELTNNVNGMSVGGTNLIPNSGTLAGVSGVVAGQTYKGNAIRRVAIAAASGSSYDQFEYELAAPVDGTECVVSFYAKANNADSLQIYVYLYYPNATLTAVSSQGRTGSWPTGGDGSMIIDLTTEWKRYWVKYTRKPGQTGTQRLIIARLQKGSKDKEIYISSPKFEYGTMPTEWSEAPSDNASANALQALTTRVTAAEGSVTSQGQAITKLTNDLGTTNTELAKKADASAVTALTQRVDQNDQSISRNTTNITDMSNRLINGLRNNWSRRIYPVQLASGSAVPSFSDIRAVAPTTVDEVADATKLDFTFAGNYTVALYSCQVKVAANTTITLGPGSRVFDDAGIVVVNGVQVASGNSTTSTVIFELKAGWNTVEFLVNQWTGQAYINLGMKLSAAVSEMYSGLGVSALSNATGVLSSNVNQIGKDVVSNAQSITQLNNSLSQTNTKVDGKADQTALNSLTGRVTTTETGLTAANNSITSLNTSVSQQSKRGANLLPDGTFESYADGYNLSNNRVLVSTDDSHGGNKCIRVTRPNDYNANATDNSDNNIFSGFQVRDNAVFYLECWVKLDAKSTAMADNVQVAVGLSLQYQDNSWQWPSLIKSAKDLSSTQWTKVSGYLKSTKSGIKQAMFRISVPNVSTVKAGNSFLIDDIVLTEVTDAYNAQSTADANASAISILNSTVTQQGDQLTSQGNSITKLTNDLATTNTEVGKKADATALTALTNRVTQTEKDISSTSTSVTTLNNKVDAISVGGTNLIKNSGAMTGWSNVVSETYRGNAVIGATVKAGSGYRDLREVILDAPVDASEYVYSFYAKGAVDGQTMSVFFYNPNTTKSAETSQGVKSGNTDGRASFTLTTSWARYWVKWKNTPGTGTKRLILCRIESSASADQSVYISSPKLEVGNVVSDWNSAPTDSASASAVDVLTTTVNQHGDTLTSIGNRTTSLENGLSTTNTNVSKKADASALQTLQNTVTQQGNDISSQGTRVTSIETNLTSGGNLIPNPRMLNNAQGWDGNATTVDGYAAVRSAAGWQPSSAPFEVTPGDTLDLSLMCLVDAAITFAWGLRFDGPNFSNKTSYVSNLSYQAGEKKAVSGTFVVPAGATTAKLQPNMGVTTGVTIYNVVITRRDAKTIANSSAIDSLTSKVNTQGDTITSIGNRTTSLENGLTTAQNDITKKADATAVQDLRNTVTNQGDSLTAANSSITKLQSSINRRTVFTITARGNGNSVTHGIFDESGATVFTPGRSWAVVTFAKQNDGSTAIATSKTYDVFGGAANGTTMASDIAALASGTYVCVMTFDEPSGNRGTITSALESLGGTSQVVNSLPYRGAYILLGRKGMKPGDGLELRAPTGGDSTAYISTSVEFVNGIMMGLGAAGGVMMKADANASAITTLQNTVTQQGNSITSSSNAITSLQNDLKTANDNIAKKADASALSVLQNTVTQQGNSIDSQSKSITNLTNSLVAGNLIVNGDLSVNADNWIDSGTGSSFSYNATDKAIQSGGNSIRVANVTAIPVEPGMTLTVSFELKASVAGTVPSADTIGFCETANFNGTWIMSQANWLKNMATTYNTNTYSFVVPANFTGKFLYLRFASGGGTPSNFTIFLRKVVVTSSTGVSAKADASALNALTSRVTTAEGKITSNANSITSLTSRVGTAESGINGLNETVASLGLAQTTTFQQLRSMIGDNSASITTTNQAFTDLENSTANSVSTLTTQFNGLSASVQQTSNAIADVNGKLSAQWGVKVETNNGVSSVAGIQLGIDATGSSAFLVKADTFGVYNPNASGGMNLAFVVKGSQTYIRESFIENGSINNAKIGNFIQSNNYVENQSGWAINKDGGAQFNNAIFRGTIYANDGVFKGTVQADRFIGDIATSASFNGFTVKGGEGSKTMNAWYQNSGYPMTITLNCTVRCNSYSGGVGDQSRDFYVVLTFNINGVQSIRRVVVDMRDKAGGLVDIPQSFTVNIPASNSRIGISLTGASYGPQQSEVSVSNIVVTAFRSNNGSFGQ